MHTKTEENIRKRRVYVWENVTKNPEEIKSRVWKETMENFRKFQEIYKACVSGDINCLTIPLTTVLSDCQLLDLFHEVLLCGQY